MASTTHTASGVISESDAPIRVELEIQIPDDAPCVSADLDMRVTDVSQHLQLEHCDCEHDCGECHIEATVDYETDVRHEYVRSSLAPSCVCTAFEQADCIPELRVIKDQKMTVSLMMPDRSALRKIVDDIEESGGTVHLKQILQLSGCDGHTVKIEPGEVTEKQREALELAVEEGYYENPPQTDLSVLADRLDVSKSAVSQRLNAVEANLVHTLVSG